MRTYASCPTCKRRDQGAVYCCREDLGGCGRRFCRHCAGGLTTLRCPRCQQAEFMGAVQPEGRIER